MDTATDAPLNLGQEVTLRTIAMPADTNPAGDIFGGWLMSQMDLAAFARSCEFSGQRTVTAAVREMIFRKPVKVGDTVLIHTSILKTGRTSVTLQVEAWRRHHGSASEKVTEAVFVMVAVDDRGHPAPLRQQAVLPVA